MEVEDHEARRRGEIAENQDAWVDQWKDASDWWLGRGKYDGSDVENASFFDTVSNWFTGNLDYRRNMELQKQAQEFNALEAQKEFERTKALRASAYQDAFKDLQGAGMNPYLLYSMGSGGAAATPGLSAARSGSNSYRNNAIGLRDILTVLASVFGTAASVGAAAANNAARQNAYNYATQSRANSAANRLAFDVRRYEDWKRWTGRK